MTLSTLFRSTLVGLILLVGSLISLSYASLQASAFVDGGDINCGIGDILDEHDLPGPSGCDEGEEEEPVDACPNDPGTQTSTDECSPGEEEPVDVCPNDEGTQTSNPCPSDDQQGGDGDQGEEGEEQSSGSGGGGGTPSSETSSGGGGGGGGSLLSTATTTTATSTGTVLGTSTPATIPASNICDGQVPYLTSYLRMGQVNDPTQVMKLQTFLNIHLDLDIPVTGFFGPQTHAAVNQFQLKHSYDVLQPWVPHGLPSAETPTGYVYKTTQRMINQLACEMQLPMPELP